MPADRLPLEFAVGDVESAINQRGETQAGAGAEFEQTHAPLDAVGERHETDASELRQRAGPFGNLPARQRPAE